MRKMLFVGVTNKTKKFQSWLSFLIQEKTVISTIAIGDPEFSVVLIRATLRNFKFVAVGEEAADALINAGVVQFFRLPHPSKVKNADVNLIKCKAWIEED